MHYLLFATMKHPLKRQRQSVSLLSQNSLVILLMMIFRMQPSITTSFAFTMNNIVSGSTHRGSAASVTARSLIQSIRRVKKIRDPYRNIFHATETTPSRNTISHSENLSLATNRGDIDGCKSPDDESNINSSNNTATQQRKNRPPSPPDPSTFPSWSYDPRPFFHFEILHQSTRSLARVGRIHTPHGTIDTPSYVAVATNGALKGVDFRSADMANQQLIFCNTYHLLLQPGADVVEKAGGLHNFVNRKDRPLITDSG